MNPPLLLETLAFEHQRELVEEAGRERITAAMIDRAGPWWGPIGTALRRPFAVALVTLRGSKEQFSAQMAIVDHT